MEQLKGQLWSHWLPKCIEVFRRLPAVPINNDVKAYYRCVLATLGPAPVAAQVELVLVKPLVEHPLMHLATPALAYTYTTWTQPEAQPTSSALQVPRLQSYDDVPCWCRCVATLQGNMLRQLVASSLQDCLAFFQHHAAVQPLDPQQDVARWSCMPVFETELVMHDGESCSPTVFRDPIYSSGNH